MRAEVLRVLDFKGGRRYFTSYKCIKVKNALSHSIKRSEMTKAKQRIPLYVLLPDHIFRVFERISKYEEQRKHCRIRNQSGMGSSIERVSCIDEVTYWLFLARLGV